MAERTITIVICEKRQVQKMIEIFLEKMIEDGIAVKVLCYGTTRIRGDGFIIVSCMDRPSDAIMQMLRDQAAVIDVAIYMPDLAKREEAQTQQQKVEEGRITESVRDQPEQEKGLSTPEYKAKLMEVLESEQENIDES